jgi:transposase
MLAAYDAKFGTQAQIARLFGVSHKCLLELLRQRRLTGSIQPKPHGGGHPPAFAGAKLEHLRHLVRDDPGITLDELRQRTKVRCSLVAVHNALVRLDLRYKKRRSTLPSRTGPT